jgi:transcriptional regulator with GAF, ATPase, and Fis domain
LGGTKEIQVDVRIIASTNKKLKEEVACRRFREDLYFRIAVFNIDLPPLRERIDDIPLIAEYLWNELTLKMGRKLLTPPFSLENLKKFPWKGNVRELRNHLEKALIYLNMGEEFKPEMTVFAPDIKKDRELIPLDDYVRDYVLEALKHCSYNKAETARTLGLSLSTLKRKLLKWGVQIKREIDA